MRLCAALLLSVTAYAQSAGSLVPIARKPFVRANGEATVSAKPDQAKVNLSIVNQGKTAALVANDNAARSQAVLDKLRAALPKNTEIKTVNYNLSPQYTYPRDGGTPELNGFQASNSIEVTLIDLSQIGKTIDTGIQAGASRIEGIRMMLKNDDAVKMQALSAAAKAARAKAQAIASGLGASLGVLQSVEESSISVPRPVMMEARAMAMAAPAPTPIEAGNIDVQAVVTVEYELAP